MVQATASILGVDRGLKRSHFRGLGAERGELPGEGMEASRSGFETG
jgi:hypothetical protein